MNAITLSPELTLQLAAIQDPTEIRSPQGQLLGVFTPCVPSAKGAWSAADLKEAERIAATEKEGYTIEQVLEHLRSLEKPG